jgi:AcrR family transcriptional regulator
MVSRKKIPTRDRILDAAWLLLEESGGGEVRIADIAAKAGVSRQALYLHFPNRAELLIATTRYIDQKKDTDARLQESRAAKNGIDRLNAFIAAWGGYIPEIYGVARALMAMQNTDAEARAAWTDRMTALREGCAAAISALKRDGTLAEGMSAKAATDLLWTLLSVRNWEHLVQDCGWSQDRYIRTMQETAAKIFIRNN